MYAERDAPSKLYALGSTTMIAGHVLGPGYSTSSQVLLIRTLTYLFASRVTGFHAG